MRVSKWAQYKILKDDEEIAPFLPKTNKLTESTLWGTIEEYSQAIIKPSRGMLGRKVIQITLLDREKFTIHSEHCRIALNGRKQTYDYLKENYRTKRFIVQQKISLATIIGCPFDLRVMVQRRDNSDDWAITGKLAKVAFEGYIITNVAKSIIPVETAIQNSCLRDYPPQELLNEIDRAVLLTARRFQTLFPSCQMIGIDIGLDSNGKVWIIEANFKPWISLFKLLEDKTMYHTIRKFNRKY